MANVLIIDDEKELCEILADMIVTLGHRADFAVSLNEGLEKCRTSGYDVVFLDIRLPDGNGLESMSEIKRSPAGPEVIIMTGFADPDSAEIAIKNGAWDYLQKPISPKNVLLPIKRVLQYRDDLKKAIRPAVPLNLDGIVGNSPAMRKCFDLLAQAANTSANVLITGETGTGKELFARAIHRNSSRADKPFIVVDCAALPKTLIESVLFGHVKGAFTGADKNRDGLILGAHGGILFLDEIGEIPLSIQKAFLRVIQDHRFRPVGSNRELTSEFRLVAATHRDLADMARQGDFREDLLFRIQSIIIHLPALRERTEDIRDVAEYYAARICGNYHIEPKSISPDFMDILHAYDWPGNIRELINTLDFAIAAGWDENMLFAKHLPEPLRIKVVRNAVHNSNGERKTRKYEEEAKPLETYPSFTKYRQSAINDAEKKYFQKLIALTGGNIRESCRISGLGRTRLYALLKKHGISRYGWSEKIKERE